MTTSSTPLPAPRNGRDRIDHMNLVVEALENSVYGLTLSDCVSAVYGGSCPTDPEMLQWEVEEAKRSIKHSNERFEARTCGAVYVRTRRLPGNRWVYMAVARMLTHGVVRMIDAAVSYETYERYYSDWETRTKTLTRMQCLDIEARKDAALCAGDHTTAARIDAELDEMKVISPRLGLMYFGAGLIEGNLEVLEGDRRAWILRKELRQVRHDMKRLKKSTAALSSSVETLLRIRGLI